MTRPLALVASALLCAAPVAGGQDIAALCRKVAHPAVGSWSEFKFVGGTEDGGRLRLSVVGHETHGDTAYIWVEAAAHGMRMGQDTMSIVTKILVSEFGPGMASPRAVVVKFKAMPAMEMPANGPQGGANGAGLMAKCAEAKSLGWESVTVPAGTFRALHIKDAEGKVNMWIVPDLPLALVKQQGPENEGGGELVLTAHGTGATTVITDTPQPFNQQLLMQMMSGGNH